MTKDRDEEQLREGGRAEEEEPGTDSNTAFRKEMGRKFREAREFLNMSQNDAARAVGVAPRSWQSYESGARLPGAEVFAGLAKLNVNVTWFFSDDAPFFRDLLADMSKRNLELRVREKRMLPIPDSLVEGESFAIRSVAALGLADRFFVPPVREWRDREGNKIDRLGQQRFMAFSPEYIQAYMGDPITDVQFFFVDGDAMAPMILSGDFVTFHPGKWKREVDGLHVIKQDGAGRVRRLQFLPGDRVLVVSDNPTYQSFECSLDPVQGGIEILGRVAWVARQL